MPSLTQGSSSSVATPVLDVWTAVGSPRTLIDIAVLQFRVFDISSDSKKVHPVQVYPLSSDWQDVDPTAASPTGVRLGVGHYFAPYTVSLSEPIGDHRIEWQYRQTVSSPWESFKEEFYVAANAGPGGPRPDLYCTVEDIRAEGFTNPTSYPDSRIMALIELASRYVDKCTGRWFYPKEFLLANPPEGWVPTVNLVPGTDYPTPDQGTLDPDDRPFMIDGTDSRRLITCDLEVPICRVDFIALENQDFLDSQLLWIQLSDVRVYNRHLRGMTRPDDRENPQIAFTSAGKIYEMRASSILPAPRMFPDGRMNIYLFGVFGYTDPDPTGVSAVGVTPLLIRQVTKLLVIRDLLPEASRAMKMKFRNMYRIIGDHEGNTSVQLQQLWLKGGYTGDPDIDGILVGYRRPAQFGAA